MAFSWLLKSFVNNNEDSKKNKRLGLFAKLCGGGRFIDALLATPRSYVALKNIQKGDDITPLVGTSVSIVLTVDDIVEYGYNATQMLTPKNSICFVCSSPVLLGSQTIELKYLNGNRRIILKYLQKGKTIKASGTLNTFDGRLTIVHPKVNGKYWLNQDEDQTLMPQYNLTAGITNDFVIEKVAKIFEKITEEDLSEKDWYKGGSLTFLKALHILHFSGLYNKSEITKANNRLKFDELLARMHFAKKVEKVSKSITKPPLILPDEKIAIFEKAKQLLGFELTEHQQGAVEFLIEKLKSHSVQTSVIQGDVGSGKTAVAMLCCIYTVLCGYQACVVCPTTILAGQHFTNFERICSAININVEIITSKNTAKQKNAKKALLTGGQIDILISTHAAFVEDVEFKNLAFVVVDEQQKFGVEQRLSIFKKGCFGEAAVRGCNVAMMSATLIPRTMFMSLYHGLDTFEITQKPANRKPIITKIVSANKIFSFVQQIKTLVKQGEKVYWVCPFIEENDKINKMAVNTRFEELCKIFAEDFGEGAVAVIHGQMKEPEREAKMQKFIDSTIKILVATTVIEVGVDVKDATVIVVESAEHFGLSMLHQLRGRVGRSGLQSYCYFVYGQRSGAVARQRLAVLCESQDGFFIAKQDMHLRGSGQVYGKLQSGFNEFRFFNPQEDEKIAALVTSPQTQSLLNEPKLNTLLQVFKLNQGLVGKA